jgi:tripartite-type tricarboxylate transporter receptor subunit TctC
LQDKIKRLGGVPEPRTVKEFGDFIADQYKRWGEVLRVTGVTLD